LEGAKPWAGEVGNLESAPENRLEARVPRTLLGAVLREVRSVHPYEEMAYDVFPLVESRESIRPAAYLVEFARPVRLRTIRERLRRLFPPRPPAAGPETREFAARIAAGKANDTARRIVVCAEGLSELEIGAMTPGTVDAIVRPATASPASPSDSGIAVVEYDPSVAEYAVLIELGATLTEKEGFHPIDAWG
jgi:hypothetical protein